MAKAWQLPFAAALLALSAGAMVASTVLAARLHGVAATRADMLDAVPVRFATWHAVPQLEPIVNPWRLDGLGHPAQIYDRIVSRTYEDAAGNRIMLMLAYKRELHQEDRIHSPELCYFAQGFVLSHARTLLLPIAGKAVQARAFTGISEGRNEDVIYWIRSGSRVIPTAIGTRAEIFMKGLHGTSVDGILVRASLIYTPDSALTQSERQALTVRFLAGLVAASPAATQTILLGAKAGQAQ